MHILISLRIVVAFPAYVSVLMSYPAPILTAAVLGSW